MLQTFQRDLFSNRLQVARAYAHMLNTASTPVSLTSDSMLKVVSIT